MASNETISRRSSSLIDGWGNQGEGRGREGKGREGGRPGSGNSCRGVEHFRYCMIRGFSGEGPVQYYNGNDKPDPKTFV